MTEPTLKLTLPPMIEVWQNTFNWQPSNEQQVQFNHLYQTVITANQHLNLTRITEETDFWEKHIWDSLAGIFPRLQPGELPDKGHLLDIGTGAGFPGLPIAISCPNYQVTLLDSTQKKIAFVQNLIAQLGLQNAQGVPGRAEELYHKKSEQNCYDLVTLRAVAPAPQCAKYALPFLKLNGIAILYRGHWTVAEEESLHPVIDKLGGVLESVSAFKTPLTQSVRHCLYLRKIRLGKG